MIKLLNCAVPSKILNTIIPDTHHKTGLSHVPGYKGLSHKPATTTRTLSTGSPQGCVLRPLQSCPYTHNHYCSLGHNNNNLIIKIADNNTEVSLISKEDEAAYKQEVLKFVEKNLSVKTKKGLLVSGHPHLHWHLWTDHITVVIKKAQQQPHFLRVLWKHNLDTNPLRTKCSFNQSLLTCSITIGYVRVSWKT